MVDYECGRFGASIVFPGEWSRRTSEDRGKLMGIVEQYFRQVRKEFGCDTIDYMPYNSDLPEFDPAIANQMEAAVLKLVAEDPECERLIRKIGGVFPPVSSEKFDSEAMCYGPGWGGRPRVV
jgi:hypothetical protein